MATVKRKGNKQPADDPALAKAVEKAVDGPEVAESKVVQVTDRPPVGDLADKLARSRR